MQIFAQVLFQMQPNPIFFPALRGGESAFLHGQQKPTCPCRAGWFPCSGSIHLPSQPCDTKKSYQRLSALGFFPRDCHGGEDHLLWCQSSHSKRRSERPNTCKYLHDLVMDVVWSVAVKSVGDFLRETFPAPPPPSIGKC